MLTRSVGWLIVALVASMLNGCGKGLLTEPELIAEPRAALPVLTMDHAMARSDRIGKVGYDLEFELDGNQAEYTGRVIITFDLGDSDGALTLDFVGGSVSDVSINDHETEVPYNGFYLTLPGKALRSGHNTVEIAFSHPYSTDGSGLYRFRDPLDGRDYLYTDFEPYDQNRLFPSFDQPDLKATYATQVTAPSDWQVISIVAEMEVEDLGDRKRWTFPESARISTYIYALHAGEYQSWESTAGDIPLRLFARASLAEYVHPEHWFVPTRQGFEFFEAYFEVPYPFGKYDQLIVPHFNAGAMENVGAVTFSERFLHSGTVTREARRSIASVIMHEMAHMWFGNLVTMDWWNGLWLNESFATFMATLAMVEATEFTEDRLNTYRRKVRAYRTDERDTTHPIELPIPDTDAALANFDAITYNKGSAALTQLNQLVGPEAFRRGVGAYLKAHAYGNTTIDNFLKAIAKVADRDLDGWQADWLRQPGTNGVSLEFECDGGVVSRMAVLQDAPAAWPTLRTHRTQLGLYNFDGDEVVFRLLPVTYSGAQTEIETTRGLRCPDFVYANHGDWDYARVEFDEAALVTLRDHLNDFDDPLIRSMFWQGVFEMVLSQRLTPMQFIDFTIVNLVGERNEEVTRQALGNMQAAWSYLRRLGKSEAVLEGGVKIERFLWTALLDSESGSDRQLLLFDHYLRAATSEQGLEHQAGFLVGEGLPDGLYFDQDRRWDVIERLSGFGHPSTNTLLASELEQDESDQGRRSGLSVEAARPDPAQQRQLMEMLLAPGPDLSVADSRAYASGIFPVHQHEAQLKIVGEVFDRLQLVNDTVDPGYFGSISRGLLGTICDEGYLEQLEQVVGRSGTLHPSLRKSLLNMRFDIRRCLAIGQAMH